MIAKRAKTGATQQIATIAGQARAGSIPARAGRYWLTGAAAAVVAVIGLSIMPTALARQWSSSSSKADDTHQQDTASKSRKVKEDVNVGTFYMHKGDYGAAISRFKEAVELDPKEGKARLLLAESYEKQGNGSAALKTYQDYLRDFPNARDDKNIRKKVEELSRKRD